ncbi:6649_t:CDS:2 [Acaulospora morrowiae]|uniref:6649_t:CDS:1 n=1 Tax=Acaulospora morrowiae TaxID=94023 RepID=A0A9N9B1M1_9GLOM|nr:6649_t:CDS:2 [Acaulospora morrowiae]
MSKSASNEYRISIDKEISYFDDKNPQHGKKINIVVLSPNMKYVATASYNARSVCVWKFTEGEHEHRLTLSHFFDLRETALYAPICVSDFNKILIGTVKKGAHVLETRDCNKEKENIKKLSNHGCCGENCGFITNGDFAIVEGYLDYHVHIFSIVRNEWHCTGTIKLVEFRHAVISRDRVLILLDVPFVILQWNLLERKFETQYELDWSLAEYRKGILMELNSDQNILGVAGRLNTKQNEDSNTKLDEDSNAKQDENSRVYFYSIESGKIIGRQSFNEKFYEKKKIIKINQKSGRKQEKTSYAITPPIPSVPNSTSSLNLCSLLNSPSESEKSGELHISAEIDFILQYHNDQSFKDQLNNELRKYKDDFEEKWIDNPRDENGVDSQREDIKKHIDDILKKYKPNQTEQFLAEQSPTQRSLTQESLAPESLFDCDESENRKSRYLFTRDKRRRN